MDKVSKSRKGRIGKRSKDKNTRSIGADVLSTSCQNTANDAFGNVMIVEHLLRYLNYSSIKILSNVSRRLNFIIRANKRFVDSTVFKFFKHGGKQGQLSINPLSLYNFPWKKVAVQLHNEWKKKEFDVILRLISNADSLHIYGAVENSFSFISKGRLQMFIDLLNAATRIKELRIDADVLDRIPIKNFKSAMNQGAETQTNLKKVESLWIGTNLKYIIKTGKNFGLILLHLSKIPQNLVEFGYYRIECDYYESDTESDKDSIQDALISILEKHTESLRSVTLEKLIWESSSIDEIRFSFLKCLNLSADGTYIERVSNFISKQPPLESLQLKFVNIVNSGRFLESALFKNGSQLKNFSLIWKYQPGPTEYDLIRQGDRNPAGIFAILSAFRSLEQVKVHQRKSWLSCLNNLESHGSEFFPLSVFSDGVREIDIRGAKAINLNPCFENQIIESLRRFCNLTILNLVQCPGVLNDKILVYICMELTQLVELGFSHCDQLTDEGLTGKSNKQDPKVSRPGLKSLKGLRKLCVMSCRQLTPDGLIDAICFDSMTKLTFVRGKGESFGMNFYVQLVKNNKSLENLVISTTEAQMFPRLEEELSRHSSRFCCLGFIRNPAEFLISSSDEDTDFERDAESDSD